jgi:hypothetical protein
MEIFSLIKKTSGENLFIIDHTHYIKKSVLILRNNHPNYINGEAVSLDGEDFHDKY